MSDALQRPETALIEAMEAAIRGPRRSGFFAVWMVMRACGDLFPPHAVAVTTHRRRLTATEQRLRSISLPPPLRRAITGAMQQMDPGTMASAHMALRQLEAPVRETLGRAAGDALRQAAAIAEREVRRSREK